MSNVDRSQPDDDQEFDLVLNPLERFQFTEDEMVQYLKDNYVPGVGKKSTGIRDYKRDKDKPVIDVFKILAFAYKDGGKTNFINTLPELDERFGNKEKKTGVKYDLKLSHLKFLLEEGYIKRGGPLEILDGEGKGDVLSPKFPDYPTRHRKLFYPNGPMPVMQDPVAFIKELVLFLKSVTWAHKNPDLYTEMTVDDEDYPDGLKAPNACAFENYTILTNEIMNYVRTVSHEDKINKLVKKGQELGAPLEPKFDNWDIRNRNWDYKSGFIQIELPVHYIATGCAKKIWKDSKPTDEDDAALYNKASHAFNAVIFLWHVKDPETYKVTFWGQIASSDFMDEDTALAPIKNPSVPKIVGELCKRSHCMVLENFGKWKKMKTTSGKEVYIWFKNKEVKPVKKVAKKVVKKPTKKASKKPTRKTTVIDEDLIATKEKMLENE